MYITYITENLVTGEFYIGSHKLSDEDDHYLGSGKLLREGVRKYGEENFVRHDIASFDNREDSIKLEHELIKKKKSDKGCLNLSFGGFSFDYINDNLILDRSAFGAMASHDYATKMREKNIEEYNKSPKLCKYCGNPIQYDTRLTSIFCSQSCAASYNNSVRIREIQPRYCVACGKQLQKGRRKSAKFCDSACQHIYYSDPCHRKESDKRKNLKQNKLSIEKMHNDGISYRKIASIYGVSATMIEDLLKNRL